MAWVYIAVDENNDDVLYTGEDQSDAQAAIQEEVERNPKDYLMFDVGHDGDVGVTFTGSFKIVEVRV